MAMRVLPPGFRFHPTDVELLKYYLKRKILGRPFFEAIQEVSIYKLDPWELPGLSCLKSDDQKWYFFCPRERRYGQGERAKRSTEGGFWKTTGRDRPVMYNDEPVGMIKTLIFHKGRAANGSRTDWVMHEYRLEDRDLAAKGIPQDSYVVCAIFKKKGPGPRNGAQYGAPFREEDWDDDEVSAVLPSDLLLAARGSEQACVPLQEEQLDHYARNQAEANTDLSESITVVGTPPPLVAASETVLPELSEAGPSTSAAGINYACEARLEDILIDPNTDGMDVDELLAMFDTSVDNNNQETQTATAGPDGGGTLAAPAAEGNAIFADLPDLDVEHYGTWSCANGFGFGSHYFPPTAGFVELLDLGQHSSEATTYPANLQGSEINTRNAGDRSPDEWRRLG